MKSDTDVLQVKLLLEFLRLEVGVAWNSAAFEHVLCVSHSCSIRFMVPGRFLRIAPSIAMVATAPSSEHVGTVKQRCA